MDETNHDSAKSTTSAETVGGKSLGTSRPIRAAILMGITLDVSLSFGQCQLPLREILELRPESVVEFDQRIDEPVELLVGGRVVARGEVVTADESYGLRISEIIPPERAKGS